MCAYCNEHHFQTAGNQLFVPHKDKEDDVETRKERDSDEQN